MKMADWHRMEIWNKSPGRLVTLMTASLWDVHWKWWMLGISLLPLWKLLGTQASLASWPSADMFLHVSCSQVRASLPSLRMNSLSSICPLTCESELHLFRLFSFTVTTTLSLCPKGCTAWFLYRLFKTPFTVRLLFSTCLLRVFEVGYFPRLSLIWNFSRNICQYRISCGECLSIWIPKFMAGRKTQRWKQTWLSIFWLKCILNLRVNTL